MIVTLGNTLRSVRAEKKITQQQVANFLKINRVTYAQYELGTRDPDTTMLKKLADYFEVSTDYLLGREEGIKNSNDISQEDIDLLEKMKNLPPEKRKAMELLLGFAENVETGSN